MRLYKWTYYILFGVCALLTSCIYDDYADVPDVVEQQDVAFNLQTVSTSAKTRSIEGIDENYIKSLHVLVFDADDKYLYAKTAESVSNSNADGSLKTASFKFAKADVVENVRLVFIANVTNAQDIISSLMAGASLSSVQSMFVFECRFKWNVNSSSDFMPIPMWSTTGVVPIVKTGETGITVKMIRALSRVNVSLNGGAGLSGVKLSSVDVYNHRSGAHTWPAAANLNSLKDAVTAPTIDASTPLAGAVLSYTPTLSAPNTIYGSIYMAETNNEAPNRPCIVAGLEIDGNLEYFRLDFVDADSKFLPVLRNHSYNFDIIGFVGVHGHSTKDAAYQSDGANVLYTLNEIEDSSHNIMITDKHHLLCMDKDHFDLPLTGGSAEWLVYTDDPTGWRIDESSFNINGTAVAGKPSDLEIYMFETTDGVYSGISDLNYYLTVSVGSVASARTVSFNVAVGDNRMYKTVTISQQ